MQARTHTPTHTHIYAGGGEEEILGAWVKALPSFLKIAKPRLMTEAAMLFSCWCGIFFTESLPFFRCFTSYQYLVFNEEDIQFFSWKYVFKKEKHREREKRRREGRGKSVGVFQIGLRQHILFKVNSTG